MTDGEVAATWARNEAWHDEMALIACIRAANGIQMMLRSKMTGRLYRVFPSDFVPMLQGLGRDGGVMVGAFVYTKRGRSYGVKAAGL